MFFPHFLVSFVLPLYNINELTVHVWDYPYLPWSVCSLLHVPHGKKGVKESLSTKNGALLWLKNKPMRPLPIRMTAIGESWTCLTTGASRRIFLSITRQLPEAVRCPVEWGGTGNTSNCLKATREKWSILISTAFTGTVESGWTDIC